MGKTSKRNAIVEHAKVRTYYTFKPKFKKEIYLQAIKNRAEENVSLNLE